MRRSIPLLAVAAAAAVAFPAAALASGGGGAVTSVGKCSAASTSKIKVKPDNGLLEVEFQVDQNKNGVTWNVTLKDNSQVVFSGTRVTKAPSGSFTLTRKITNQPGPDAVAGIATNPKSGERCVAKVTV